MGLHGHWAWDSETGKGNKGYKSDVVTRVNICNDKFEF